MPGIVGSIFLIGQTKFASQVWAAEPSREHRTPQPQPARVGSGENGALEGLAARGQCGKQGMLSTLDLRNSGLLLQRHAPGASLIHLGSFLRAGCILTNLFRELPDGPPEPK